MGVRSAPPPHMGHRPLVKSPVLPDVVWFVVLRVVVPNDSAKFLGSADSPIARQISSVPPLPLLNNCCMIASSVDIPPNSIMMLLNGCV